MTNESITTLEKAFTSLRECYCNMMSDLDPMSDAFEINAIKHCIDTLDTHLLIYQTEWDIQANKEGENK